MRNLFNGVIELKDCYHFILTEEAYAENNLYTVAIKGRQVKDPVNSTDYTLEELIEVMNSLGWQFKGNDTWVYNLKLHDLGDLPLTPNPDPSQLRNEKLH